MSLGVTSRPSQKSIARISDSPPPDRVHRSRRVYPYTGGTAHPCSPPESASQSSHPEHLANAAQTPRARADQAQRRNPPVRSSTCPQGSSPKRPPHYPSPPSPPIHHPHRPSRQSTSCGTRRISQGGCGSRQGREAYEGRQDASPRQSVRSRRHCAKRTRQVGPSSPRRRSCGR